MNRLDEQDALIEEAQAHWAAREFDEAFKVYDRALQLFSVEELKGQFFANFCNNLASALEATTDYARAETLFEAARSVFVELDSARDVAMVDLNLGLVLKKLAKLDQSAARLDRARRGFAAVGDMNGVGRSLTTLAVVHLATRRPGAAQAALEEVAALQNVLDEDTDLHWSYHFQRAELASQTGDFDAARGALQVALDLAEAIGDSQYLYQTRSAAVELPSRIERFQEQASQNATERKPPSSPVLDQPLAPPMTDAELEISVSAAGRSGAHALVFPLVTTQAIVLGEGPAGSTVIDPGAADFVDRFARLAQSDRPLAASQLRNFSIQAVQSGVQLRQKGDLGSAYVFQRFGFQVVLKQGDLDGLVAVSRNIWSLREVLRDILERAGGPARGGFTPEGEAVLKEHLKLVQNYVVADAVQTLDDLAALARQAEATDLRPWRALHRMACIAGDAETLQEARAHLEPVNDETVDPGLVAAVEDVAQMDLLEVLAESGAGIRLAPDSAEASIWSTYMRLREQFSEIADPSDAVAALSVGFRHLCFLRLNATTGGGVFGHEISYRVSSMLQTVGRDLAALLRAQGQTEAALMVAETLLARSMADWLGRTHAIWDVPPEFKAVCSALTGSLNASAVAGLGHVRSVAQLKDTPIVYMLRVSDRHEIWVVRRDGRMVHATTGSIAPLLVQLLPSLAAGPATADRKAMRDRALQELYLTLFPEFVRTALADQGDKLAIVADPSIQSLPFAALRTPDGRYLVEEIELVFWPSVTALLNLEAGAGRNPAERARQKDTQPPLVAGISSFKRGYQVNRPGGPGILTFPDLPGATVEAELVGKLLNVKPVANEEVGIEQVYRRGTGSKIIHLATHGYLDQVNPRMSFLALPDGPLTADSLYMPGSELHTRLVTLSSCRSAIGSGHDDSAIGLTNGFLIAGAESVLSTLWPIDDAATPTFMKTFYGALIDGESIAAAVRRGQLALLREPAFADPYFWAPFLLTGRAENPIMDERPDN